MKQVAVVLHFLTKHSRRWDVLHLQTITSGPKHQSYKIRSNHKLWAPAKQVLFLTAWHYVFFLGGGWGGGSGWGRKWTTPGTTQQHQGQKDKTWLADLTRHNTVWNSGWNLLHAGIFAQQTRVPMKLIAARWCTCFWMIVSPLSSWTWIVLNMQVISLPLEAWSLLTTSWKLRHLQLWNISHHVQLCRMWCVTAPKIYIWNGVWHTERNQPMQRWRNSCPNAILAAGALCMLLKNDFSKWKRGSYPPFLQQFWKKKLAKKTNPSPSPKLWTMTWTQTHLHWSSRLNTRPGWASGDDMRWRQCKTPCGSNVLASCTELVGQLCTSQILYAPNCQRMIFAVLVATYANLWTERWMSSWMSSLSSYRTIGVLEQNYYSFWVRFVFKVKVHRVAGIAKNK